MLTVESSTETIDNPLHEAAKRGNLPFLQECLENRVSEWNSYMMYVYMYMCLNAEIVMFETMGMLFKWMYMYLLIKIIEIVPKWNSDTVEPQIKDYTIRTY